MGKNTITVNPEEIVPKESSLKPIPQEITIKQAWVDRYQELQGDEYENFLCHSLSYARKAIRVNTLKISVAELKKRLSDWNLEPVSWCPEGFFISYKHEQRFDIGNLPEHQLGYIYVQDPASMIPPVVLDPQPGEIVLDLCAAPGSKTTQCAMYMKNTGIILANDVSGSRVKPLGLNIMRCGIMNTTVVLKANKQLKPVFDKVLVDAPCSATGTVRRSLKSLQMWSPGAVQRISSEQRRIMEQGWAAVKPGGVMVYSTCTLEPEENEGNISTFLEYHPEASLEKISLDIKQSPAVTEFNGRTYNPDVTKCLRISPQDNDTEGFFVAKLRKASP